MTHCIVYYTDDKSLLIERIQDVSLCDEDDREMVIGDKVRKDFEVSDLNDEGFNEITTQTYGGFITFMSDGKKKCEKVHSEMMKIDSLENMVAHGQEISALKARGANQKYKNAIKSLVEDQCQNQTAKQKSNKDPTISHSKRKAQTTGKQKAKKIKPSDSVVVKEIGMGEKRKLEVLARNLEATRLQTKLKNTTFTTIDKMQQQQTTHTIQDQTQHVNTIQQDEIPKHKTSTTLTTIDKTQQQRTTQTIQDQTQHVNTIQQDETPKHKTSTTLTTIDKMQQQQTTHTIQDQTQHVNTIQQDETPKHKTKNTTIQELTPQNQVTTQDKTPQHQISTPANQNGTPQIHTSTPQHQVQNKTSQENITSQNEAQQPAKNCAVFQDPTPQQHTATHFQTLDITPQQYKTTHETMQDKTPQLQTPSATIQDQTIAYPPVSDQTQLHHTATYPTHSTVQKPPPPMISSHSSTQLYTVTDQPVQEQLPQHYTTTHQQPLVQNQTPQYTPAPPTFARRSLNYNDTTSDFIGNSFSVLYGQIGHQTPTELPSQVQCCCHCSHYGNMIMNLQQSVQDLQTEVARLQVNERERQMMSNANNSNDANSCNNGSILYNGFTKEQLNCKIMSSKDFSKATKLLFRTMYKKEEIVGRSATGFSGRNAIDQRKKEVLIEIIQEKFHVTVAEINRKIGELLKPSGRDFKK